MSQGTSHNVKPSAWGLIALPAVLAVSLVCRYGIDVPFWDEWAIAVLLRRIDDGTLTLGALFSQHNEHRMLVPLTIQILAAHVGTWDTRVGMWLTQGVLAAMLGGCISLWRPPTGPRYPLWMVVSFALVSLLLFSPAQHQNLFWGFQVSFYLPAACLLASTIVAAAPAIGLGAALALIAALSTVASFSHFAGLMTWPLSAAAVMLVRGRPGRHTRLMWCAWTACVGGVMGVYFLGYEPPTASPSVWLALGDPVALAGGVAVCVGGLLCVGAHPVGLAIFGGAAISIAFLSLLAVVWRYRSDASLVIGTAPWIVMGSFGFLTAIAIAIGRVGYGYVALLESRYVAFTVWILISILMIAATLRARLETAATRRMWHAVVACILALSAVGLPYHLASARRGYHERLQSLAIYTFAEAAPRAVPLLPPWLDWFKFRQTLFAVEQSGWRQARRSVPDWVDEDMVPTPCGFGSIEFLTPAGQRTDEWRLGLSAGIGAAGRCRPRHRRHVEAHRRRPATADRQT